MQGEKIGKKRRKWRAIADNKERKVYSPIQAHHIRMWPCSEQRSPVTKLVVMRLLVIEVAGCWYVKMGVAVVTGSGGSGAGGGSIAAIAANMLVMARTMLTSQTYTTAIQNHGNNHHIAVDSPGLVAQSERSDAQTLDSSSSSDRLATCQSICERQSLPDSTPEECFHAHAKTSRTAGRAPRL